MVALRRGGEVAVYVSWNGDTVTKAWGFYARAGARSVKLGEKDKTSFETGLAVALGLLEELGEEVKISAVALGEDGEVLGRSGEVEVQDDLYMKYEPETLVEVGRLQAPLTGNSESAGVGNL